MFCYREDIRKFLQNQIGISKTINFGIINMVKNMKKLILAFILICVPNFVYALELNSENYILYNRTDDIVVLERNKDEKTSMASLTKIMTALVSIENIADLDEKVIITNEMLKGLAEANVAVIGLSVNRVVTYRDLLYGTMLNSGGDAVQALSIATFGSLTKTIEAMNQKAKDLGLQNTLFANVIGLDDVNNYSTMKDLLTLLDEALKNDVFYTIFTTEIYNSEGFIAKSSMSSTAQSLGIDASMILGAKTGFTNEAGRCLASIAVDEDDKIEYIFISVKASTNINQSYHIRDAVNTYSYVFTNYGYQKLAKVGDAILTLNTKYSSIKKIEFYVKEDIYIYGDSNVDSNLLRYEYIGDNLIVADLNQGTKLGEIKVYYAEEQIDSIPIILSREVPFSYYEFFLVHRNVIFISCGLVIVLFLGIKVDRYKKKHKLKFKKIRKKRIA